MRIIAALALIIFTLILHTTLFDLIAINGIRPDLLLVILVFFALRSGSISGTLIGFVIGFFQDLYSPQMFGLNALAKSITGYLLGLNKDRIYWGSYLVQVEIIFIAMIFHDTVYFLFYSLHSVSTFFRFMLFQSLPTAAYTAAMGPLVIKVFNFVIRGDRGDGSRIISIQSK